MAENVTQKTRPPFRLLGSLRWLKVRFINPEYEPEINLEAAP
jgi:hypothetical protein